MESATNQLTNKPPVSKHQVSNNVSVDQGTDHFSTVAEKITISNSVNNSLDKLYEFFQSKIVQNELNIQ